GGARTRSTAAGRIFLKSPGPLRQELNEEFTILLKGANGSQRAEKSRNVPGENSVSTGNLGRLAVLVLLTGAVLGMAEAAGARSLTKESQQNADADAQARPVVMGARIGEHPGLTRFVLELSDPVTPRVFTLANPDRVVMDLPGVLWRIGTPDRPSGRGAIRSYRYGAFR